MNVLRLRRPSPSRAKNPLNAMVVSFGRSRMLIMRNQIKSNQIKSTIIPYFQIEQNGKNEMNILQKKLVVMMEDLNHYNHLHSSFPLTFQNTILGIFKASITKLDGLKRIHIR